MSRARLWILVLAVLSFLCGAAVCAVFLLAAQSSSPLMKPYADYENRFISTFRPTGEQVRLLRKILISYHSEREEVKNRYASVMEPGLRKAGRRAEGRLLEILTAEQKSHYGQLVLAEGGFLSAQQNNR